MSRQESGGGQKTAPEGDEEPGAATRAGKGAQRASGTKRANPDANGVDRSRPEIPGVSREFGPARVLSLGGSEELRDEMMRLGVDPAGMAIMLPKGAFLVVRVKRLGYAQAGILKQEMLSLGGECAHARGVVTAQSPVTDVLLMGTRANFERLCAKLAHQPFSLGMLAEHIMAAVERHGTRELPPTELKGASFRWGTRTHIMGILNVTPDSFSDGGRLADAAAAIERGLEMVGEGADIIDVGGESTRPGSDPVGLQEEMDRVLPVVERLAARTRVPVSVDTRKAAVAREALRLGAVMINDVTALRDDPGMASAVAGGGSGVVLMHMLGEPRIMQDSPEYDDLMEQLHGFFVSRVRVALEAGIPRDRIIIDPGIGFGKTLAHNVTIISRLEELRCLGLPVLVGPSRKRFIGELTGAGVGDRVHGTVASAVASVRSGADMVRVHDVAAAAQALKVADALFRRCGDIA